MASISRRLHGMDHKRRSYNALCESFFATLECELLDRERFRTQADARLAIFDFIEGWYNPRRRHSALDYLSPMIYERSHWTRDRTVPSGSMIDPGALSRYPPRRGCSDDSRKQFTVHRTGATPGRSEHSYVNGCLSAPTADEFPRRGAL